MLDNGWVEYESDGDRNRIDSGVENGEDRPSF